jgi:DNA-binding transcriptional LysR family regulator
MITLARLRHALTLAEQRSFHRAAETLQISQPALTKSIQVLETTLGVQLFDRQPGGVVLTEFGELVVEHTRKMVATEREMLRGISMRAHLETGSVEVALGPYPSMMVGYAAIGRLLTKHPKVNISIRVANWREVTRMVAGREVDLGVAELSDAVLNESLQTELVGQAAARFFCRPDHPILARGTATLSDLLQFPWATTRFPPRIAAAFPRPTGPAGRIDLLTGEFVPAIELDVPMQLSHLVSTNDVIAIGTLTMVEKDLEAAAFAVIPTPDLKIRASYGFIWRRNEPLPLAVQAFMEAFRDEERDTTERECRLERKYAPERQRSP